MGIILGIISGFLDGLKNVAAKSLTHEFPEIIINFMWMLFATFITVPFALAYLPSSLTLLCAEILISVTFIDFIAYKLYLKSIKHTDLSLSLPMLALTPVFVLIISNIFLKQEIKITGIAGVLVVILGSYLLNVKKGNQNFLSPFLNIFTNKGVRFMLFTSLLWGIANSIHKYGIAESTPQFYTAMSYLLLSIVFFMEILLTQRKELSKLKEFRKLIRLSPVGILEGLTTLFQFLSQGLLTSSVLTIALKRTSIVFGSLFGFIFFKEKIASRIIPILLVILGVILISL